MIWGSPDSCCSQNGELKVLRKRLSKTRWSLTRTTPNPNFWHLQTHNVGNTPVMQRERLRFLAINTEQYCPAETNHGGTASTVVSWVTLQRKADCTARSCWSCRMRMWLKIVFFFYLYMSRYTFTAVTPIHNFQDSHMLYLQLLFPRCVSHHLHLCEHTV